MVTVTWTDSAISDLNAIGEFISKDSEKYAGIVVQGLFESADLLELHPKAGRMVPEFQESNIIELI